MKQKDGGPYHPTLEVHGRLLNSSGISLRDHFAGLAMQGAMVNSVGLGEIDAAKRAPYLARTAGLFYEIADAMIRAREAGQ